VAELSEQGKALNLIENLDVDVNIRSLKQTLLYGLKGIAAYADHAAILGQQDPAVAAFCYEALAVLLVPGLTVEQCVPVAMKAGEINLRAMELLDAANTGTYGHPVPTPVPLGHRPNKCILITGHDLHDLELLLQQTEGKGIDIYTHGEMLPCHGYPELKKYPISTAISARPGRISTRNSPSFRDRSCSPPTASRSRATTTRTGSSPTAWSAGRACNISATRTIRPWWPWPWPWTASPTRSTTGRSWSVSAATRCSAWPTR
jgi:hydroxylamine reductase (hybrid-cluster protein)